MKLLDPDLNMEATISIASIKGWTEEMVLADVEERIRLGEDINQQVDRVSTPIMRAAASGYLSVVKRLVDAGADLTIKDRWKEDVISCAKLSENREVINFVKAATKGGAATSVPVSLYFIPKAGGEAEYTFIPSTQFKKEHDGEEDDVGYFLNDREVLKLDPVKPTEILTGTQTIFIEEGKVMLHQNDWEVLNQKRLKTIMKKDGIQIHDISCIKNEYLSNS